MEFQQKLQKLLFFCSLTLTGHGKDFDKIFKLNLEPFFLCLLTRLYRDSKTV